MSDSLQRFLFEGAPVRGELVHLDATWRAVLERHDYPAPLRSVMGELMAAAALLSATLKFQGSLILQIQGSGAVKLIVVECTSDQTMRATAKWDGELAQGGFRELVGGGRFVITIAPNDVTQTYQGIVELSGDSVAAVLEHYMVTSEQLQTRLWLASDGAQAAGMLLQRVPGAAQDADAWNRAVTLGDTVRSEELLTLSARQVIHRLFHEEDVRLFEARIVSFRCSCSRERVVNMLRMLGHGEIRSILHERGAVEVGCEFCNRRYRFDAVDAEQIFAADLMTPAGSTRH
ncbi:MAG TPA: Hsp33 family molecular chaperone HslO [Burkholderiales bacterium]|nr:Hsp33 family molecular chaperone HslO [Burkholderiales bacterium]